MSMKKEGLKKKYNSLCKNNWWADDWGIINPILLIVIIMGFIFSGFMGSIGCIIGYASIRYAYKKYLKYKIGG